MAPEFNRGEAISEKTDIYGYAKAVVEWNPPLCNTAWFKKATADKLADRYSKVRQVYLELESAITETASGVDQNETPETTSRTGIVPKFRLTVKAEPAAGGSVSGGGVYHADEFSEVKAFPNRGWRFVKWTGDLETEEPIATVKMIKNKNITGKFERYIVESALPEEVVENRKKDSAPKFNLKLIIPTVVFVALIAGAIGYFFSGKVATDKKEPAIVVENTASPQVATTVESNQTSANVAVSPASSPVTIPAEQTTSRPAQVVERSRTPVASTVPVNDDVDWEVDSRAGVKLTNSGARGGEVISWSGGNSDGYADGTGTLSYFKGGVLQRQMKGNWNQGRLVNGTRVTVIYPDRQVSGYVRNGNVEY